MIRNDFEAADLVAKHPPQWRNTNKRVVYEVALQGGLPFHGTIAYSRWRAGNLPDAVDLPGKVAVEARKDVYDYRPAVLDAPALEWHVNFADPHLFVAYGSGLFAQDEMQVAEHPSLGSLREALLEQGQPAVTVERGKPTPVLVRGVERRVVVNTAPAAGRPGGLYGNRFAMALQEAIRAATTPLDQPTITNFIAMAAPSGGYGKYKREEIEAILVTAYTGFAAARRETIDAAGEKALTVVHTGFWGCGAFGGNRKLMAMLQVLAMSMANLDRLVFHAFDEAGVHQFEEAIRTLKDEYGEGRHPTAAVIDRLTAMGFDWGLSDGN